MNTEKSLEVLILGLEKCLNVVSAPKIHIHPILK